MAVIGSGAWGTALAQVLADGGYPVTMWSYEEKVASDINSLHENSVYLPGIELSEQISATSDLSDAVIGADLILSVCPAQHVVA